jgi:hypothetical protein
LGENFATFQHNYFLKINFGFGQILTSLLRVGQFFHKRVVRTKLIFLLRWCPHDAKLHQQTEQKQHGDQQVIRKQFSVEIQFPG